MGKPPLEVLDPDVADTGIPYTSRLKVGEHELAVGDILAPVDTQDEESGLAVRCFEEILSFHWKGIITRVYDGAVEAEFRTFETFVDRADESILVGRRKGQTSFRMSEDVVQTLKVARYVHSGGMQHFTLTLDRPVLQEDYSSVAWGIHDDAGEMVDALYRDQEFASVTDAERVYEMFLDVGVQEASLSDPQDCVEC
jgi:hypothetical protein